MLAVSNKLSILFTN